MNPYLLAAAVIALVCAFCGGYWWGADAKENEMMAQHAVALEGKISEHNENAGIDMAAAAEWAAKQARAQGIADGRKAALAELGRSTPPPAGCIVAEPVRSLLNAAVDDSNNRAPSPDRVPGPVPGAAAPAVGVRTGPAPVGAGADRASGRLPSHAR